MTRAARLNKRNEIAKELVVTALLGRVLDLEKHAKENHQRELQEWRVELENIEEAEDVHLCVLTSSSFVHHLLLNYHIEHATP